MLHKLRESIMEHADKTPMDGLIHIDGAHVSSRVRKARRPVKVTKTQARDKVPSTAYAFHPNRRIVMVLRQVDTTGKKGPFGPSSRWCPLRAGSSPRNWPSAT